MTRRRTLVIGLDGFDAVLAERFISEGALPNLARLKMRSARYELDHGIERNSGLTWEHFSSGKAPSDGGRWSAVTFDRTTYEAVQEPTSLRPFMADLSARTVVFDLPYCDLARAPEVSGLTSWGAHDPGVAAASRPEGIHQELERLFGPYPAAKWIYGFCWPSADKALAASDALTSAVAVRARAARWLLTERLPDWDLAIVVVSEGHSAIEPLWHGVDPAHPLHTIASAVEAKMGLRQVYDAIDRLIGDLQEAFADATLLVTALHGMGPNDADVPAMLLLPELLYRLAFATPYMRLPAFPRSMPDGTPLLAENEVWEEIMFGAVPRPPPDSGQAVQTNVAWMPAARYSHFWPRMRAFALPAYYDGRIRLNVAGREARGLVPENEYARACDRLIALLDDCRNLLTGEKVIADVYCPKRHANDVGATEADLYVIWQSAPLGLSHPQLGSIGPAPFRRTGGHTGPCGFLYIAGAGITPGDRGLASSFDVVPTIMELLGETRPPGISGASLARRSDAFV